MLITRGFIHAIRKHSATFKKFYATYKLRCACCKYKREIFIGVTSGKQNK
jgi:hypothetical protein